MDEWQRVLESSTKVDMDNPSPYRDSSVVLKDVSKEFGKTSALARVTLQFNSGSTALLGRNGAGKSTLMNLISGIVLPSDGDIKVGGYAAGSKAACRLLARQLEFPGTAGSLTPKRLARLLAMTPKESGDMKMIMGQFEVPDKPMCKLSRGNQLKLALSVAFARTRPILLLDEPTSGLDAFGVHCLTELIMDRQRQNLVTVVATHQPTLTPELFDRAIVIDEGRICFDGTLPDLLALAGGERDGMTPTGKLAGALASLLQRGSR